MMQVSRTCSKCLIWFAALLSPIQALQGTPIFRAVVSELQSPHCVCTNQIADAGEHGECVRCRSSRCQCRDGEKCRDHIVASSPVSPRECPPDCWCRRPAEPQSQPIEPVRLTLTAAQVAVSAHQADHGMDIGRYAITRHVLAADSAQQVCVRLCRLLT